MFVTAIVLQFGTLHSSSHVVIRASDIFRVVALISFVILLAERRWYRGSDRIDCAVKASAGIFAIATVLLCFYLMEANVLPHSSAMLNFVLESLFAFGGVAAFLFWVAFVYTFRKSNER